MSITEVNKQQVEVMESLGFKYNRLNSSVYNARWDFSVYPDLKDHDTFTFTYKRSPDIEVNLLEVLKEMALYYYNKGENSVIYPVLKALKIK